MEQPALFKKVAKRKPASITSRLENQQALPKPQNIDQALKALAIMIQNLGTSMREFCVFALDSS